MIYFGFDQLDRGMQTHRLDRSEIKSSVRFTAIRTASVVAIHFRIRYAVNSPTYRAGLQEDLNGKPSGKWLGSGTFTPPSLSEPGAWIRVSIQPVSIEESKIYHVVIQYESGAIGDDNYAVLDAHLLASVRLYPNNIRDENYANLRTSDGGLTWATYTDCAVKMLIEYSDGTKYGFPYYEVWHIEIYGANQVQMYLTIAKRIIITTIELVIKKMGTPPDDLTVVLRNETDSVDVYTVDIPQEKVPAYTALDEFVIVATTEIVLYANKVYTLTLKSPLSDSSNYYFWREFDAAEGDAEYTWEGSRCHGRVSKDGGVSWRVVAARDHSFRFAVKFNPALKNVVNSGL
ncbi:MAG: hypothetical protein QXI11_08065 [Thermoproteota archaeon]